MILLATRPGPDGSRGLAILERPLLLVTNLSISLNLHLIYQSRSKLSSFDASYNLSSTTLTYFPILNNYGVDLNLKVYPPEPCF
jgi:hypothetical protein